MHRGLRALSHPSRTLDRLRTVVLGPPSQELEQLIESRRTAGADRYDEVWEGDYHMAPIVRGAHGLLDGEMAALLRPLARRAGLYASGGFNLGEPDNYRVPDRGIHRKRSNVAWFPTAALVVEIVSPDDESWAKLPFYAAHDVDEVVIADARDQSLAWLRLDAGEYRTVERSVLLDVDVAEFATQIDWPPTDG